MVRLLMILMLFAVTNVVWGVDTLRCKSKIVSAGMDTETILKHCGKPDSRQIEDRPVRARGRAIGSYRAEIWTYNRGSGQFPAVLEFHGDELKSITYIRN